MKKLFFLTIFSILIFIPALIWYLSHSDQPAQLDNYTLPKELVFNDQIIPLNWTDNNDNEDLIIQSDRKYYHGHNSSVVYFSITNISNQDQETEINFLFDNNDNRGVKSITKIAEQDRTDFYRAIIFYPENSQGEFFIEAKGNKGGYGYLDPYYAGGLVGYWSFNGDDMDWSSTTAEVLDRSGQGNNGNAVNDPQPAFGISGQALDFDGVDDYVKTAGPNIASDFTISLWFKRGSTGTWQTLSTGFTGVNIKLIFQLGNTNKFYVWTGTALWSNTTITDTNNWHHGIFMRSGSTGTIYLDGSSDGSGTVGSNDTTGNKYIGSRDGTQEYFSGLIDEVRVYNRALSADEVRDLYRADAGRAKFNSPLVNTGSDSGLVGHWTFNGQDMDWSSTTAEVLDRSGQGNNGDATNDPKPAFGISGQALEFDGVDDYVDVGGHDSLDFTDTFTISAWVYFRGDRWDRIVAKDSPSNTFKAYDFFIHDYDRMRLRLGYGTNYWQSSGQIVPKDSWRHIAVTFDVNAQQVIYYLDGVASTPKSYTNGSLAVSELDLQIGKNQSYPAGGFWDGLIDEVRVYNRALSADEIMDLYRADAGRAKFNSPLVNTGSDSGLVGHWTFNGQDMDWSSSTAEVLDRSGQGNNGDATNDPKPAFGISGQALEFDGVDDYVDVANGYSSTIAGDDSHTISFWIKIYDISKGGYGNVLISRAGDANYYLYVGTSGGITWQCDTSLSTANGVITAETWYHLAFVKTGASTGIIYVDGVESTSGSSLGTTPSGTSEDLNIGEYYDSFLGYYTTDGLIDEVRIYNRALSTDEVRDLYRAGARRFKVK